MIKTMKLPVMMIALLGTTASAYLQDICSCLDIALVYDDVEAIRNGIPEIVSKAQSVSGSSVRMGAMSFKDTINVDCDLTEDMDMFEGAFKGGGAATRRLSDEENDSEPSSEAMNWIVSGTADEMCGPPPPFGTFRPECKKLVFLITTAAKLAGACRSPLGPADSFCSPLEVAATAVDSNVIVSVIETDDEEEGEMPATTELQTYPTMTGGMLGRISRKLSALNLLIKFINLLCMPPPTLPPVPAPTPDPAVTGDPHVHTADGRIVNIYLQPGIWTSLMQGPTFAISGRVFARNVLDLTTQWFDGFRVEDIKAGKIIFEAVLPHDVSVGRLSKDGNEVQYLNVTLGDTKCTAINKTYEFGNVAATPTKLQSAARIDDRRPIFNDKISVATPDFKFVLFVAASEDPSNFDSYGEMVKETHIDFKFKHVASPRQLGGPLAEIMYPNANRAEHSLSSKALAMTKKANVQA